MIRKFAMLAIVAGFMAACGGAAEGDKATNADSTATKADAAAQEHMNTMNESAAPADTMKADTAKAGGTEAPKEAATTTGH
jgi:hypothetical protein